MADAVLAKLAELGLGDECAVYEHEPVTTSDAHARALGGAPGTLVKNLFLKDKKGRLYVATAPAAGADVNLRHLSTRLGLGRGGLRLAPDELVAPFLGCPPGAVSPLCAAHAGAAPVQFLLDASLARAPAVLVHPPGGGNAATLGLPPAALEALLRAAGREPVYVDLSAEPAAGQAAADLQHIADAAPRAAAGGGGAGGADGQGAAAAAPPQQQQQQQQQQQPKQKAKGKAAAAAPPPPPPRRDDDSAAAAGEVIAAVLAAAGAAAGGAPPALGADDALRLRLDVEARLNALRNACYAAGFKAAAGALDAQRAGLGL